MGEGLLVLQNIEYGARKYDEGSGVDIFCILDGAMIKHN